MTPKEKANKLVDNFRLNVLDYEGSGLNSFKAKQCALIAVDEIIESWDEDLYINCGASLYWQEVKQEIKLEDVLNDEKKQGFKEFIDNHKQETLEEAAERLTYTDMLSWENILLKVSFIAGAKWQQERMYSEEDMEIIEISSIDANYIPHYQTKEGQLLATKFNVKQFKNK